MKKIYYKVLYIVLNVLILFGFIAPYLISAKSNELVILGVTLIIADISHLLFFIINLIKQLK